LVFSLIIDYDIFFKYLQSNQKVDIIKLYSAYLESKKTLKNVENTFEEIRKELAVNKKVFNKTSDNNYSKLIEIQKMSSSSLVSGGSIHFESIRGQGEKSVNLIIDSIFKNKMEYTQQLLELAESLNDIYKSQKIYFDILLSLLNSLKTLYIEDYETLIPYFEEPELVIKCIEFDIQTTSMLVYNNDANKYSTSYFHNIENFTKYLSILRERESSTLKLKFNYKEQSDIYLSNPDLLYIEKEQYDLYSFNILLNHSYNQFDIWMLYYKSIENFVVIIRSFCLHLVEFTNTAIHEYKTILDADSSNSSLYSSILNETIGVKASRNIDTHKIDSWNFVKKDNELFHFKHDSPEYKFESAYINMIKSSVKSYDCLILYLYLSEIKCLRNIKLYISELNVEQLNISYSEKLRQYYISIYKSVNDAKLSSNNKPYIPSTILWDVSKSWDFTKLDDVNKLLDESFLKAKREKNDKSITIHMNRIHEINSSIKDINRNCDVLYDTIFPSINKMQLINHCNSLFTNFDSMPTYTPRNSYWLEREIEGYNPERTNELNYNIMEITRSAYYDKVIHTRSPKHYQDWIVYNNEGNGDCFFASIRDALNGQMDVENAITNNIYTDPVLIDGTTYQRYTVNSLRRLVSNNFSEDIFKNYCNIFGNMVDGKCDIINNVDHSDQTIKPMYDLLVRTDTNGNKISRTLEEVKQYISKVCSTNSECFWADQVAIDIIEKVLKIKLIVFEMFLERENDIRMGDLVNYHDGHGDDYIVINIDSKENMATIQNTINGSEENISKDMLVLSDFNITNKFRLNCSGTNLNENPSEEINDYIFLVFTNIQPSGESPVYHYEFVRNTGNNNFIYSFEEIPEYIKYFIYNSCYRYLKPDARNNSSFGKIKDFHEYFEKIDKINTNNLQEKKLENETKNQIQELQNKKTQDIKNLDERIKSTKNEETKNILKQEMVNIIKQFDNEIDKLKEQIKDKQKEKIYSEDIIDELENQIKQIDNDFLQNQSGKSETELETERIMINNEKSSIQSEIDRLKKNVAKVGGYNDSSSIIDNPQNEYKRNQQFSYPNYYNDPRYNYNYNYNYPYPPMNYPNMRNTHYVYPNGMYPGNKYINKIKESKSKLAYYITIDLELYPGKTANMLQKSVVKCQTTFEKIREAYADIRGFDYRPSPMPEAYGYNQINDNNQINNTQTNNKTNKYRNINNNQKVNNTRRVK
jgi:hypothetical protein